MTSFGGNTGNIRFGPHRFELHKVWSVDLVFMRSIHDFQREIDAGFLYYRLRSTEKHVATKRPMST